MAFSIASMAALFGGLTTILAYLISPTHSVPYKWPGNTVTEKVNLLLALYPHETVHEMRKYCAERKLECESEWKSAEAEGHLKKWTGLGPNSRAFYRKMKGQLYAKNSSDISRKYIEPFANCVVDSNRFKLKWYGTLLSLLLLERKGDHAEESITETEKTEGTKSDKPNSAKLGIKLNESNSSSNNSNNTGTKLKESNSSSNNSNNTGTKLNESISEEMIKSYSTTNLNKMGSKPTRTMMKKSASSKNLFKMGTSPDKPTFWAKIVKQSSSKNLKGMDTEMSKSEQEERPLLGSFDLNSPQNEQMELSSPKENMGQLSTPIEVPTSQNEYMAMLSVSPTNNELNQSSSFGDEMAQSSSPFSPFSGEVAQLSPFGGEVAQSSSPFGDELSILGTVLLEESGGTENGKVATAKMTALEKADLCLENLNFAINNKVEAFYRLLKCNQSFPTVFEISAEKVELLEELKHFNLRQLVLDAHKEGAATKTVAGVAFGGLHKQMTITALENKLLNELIKM